MGLKTEEFKSSLTTYVLYDSRNNIETIVKCKFITRMNHVLPEIYNTRVNQSKITLP